MVSHDGKLKIDCRVEDFSKTGARLVINKGLALPDPMYLIATGKELGFEAVVVWNETLQYGVHFQKTFSLMDESAEAALLRPLKLARLRS